MSETPAHEPASGDHDGDVNDEREPRRVHAHAREPFIEPSPTGLLRIDAIAAGAAAAKAPGTSTLRDSLSHAPAESEIDDVAVVEAAEFALPNWTSPPTGQIPRVLLEASDVDPTLEGEIVRGPTWRQEAENFLNEEDMSFLIPEQGADDAIAGRTIDPELPFAFALDENGDVVITETAAAVLEPGDEVAWLDVLSDGPAPSPVRGRRRHAPRHARAASVSAKRNLLGATATGLVLGAVAVLCLFVGSVATMALVAVAVTIAAGELFAVLQRVAYRPATIVGLVAVPAFVVAAYLHGPVGIVGVGAVAFLAVGIWFLTGWSGDEPVVNISITLLVIGWVGGCGALAGMLLAPGAHPHGHGVTLLGGIILIVVANDVGAYLVGSRFGRHPLAVSISPGKTIEGFVGGAVLSIGVALGAVSQVFPMTMSRAAILGVVVALIAPCGDLLESRVKRDLGVKDMSNLLPNHGGLFDRIDAMLFVLPAAYLVFAIGHVS